MTIENKFESAEAGSSIEGGIPNPNDLGQAGKGEVPKEEVKKEDVVIDPKQHEELETLVGTQGDELGKLRKFFSDISPLLEKLDKSPETVQAIVDGKIDTDMAKAALEGKISIEDAKIVNKAHEEVKKDLGKEGYEGSSPEDVKKLVEEKVGEATVDFDKKLKSRDDMASFESTVNDFIARTPDFAKHAEDIDKWLDTHDVTDIAVAYYAVKGELSEKEAKKQADIDKAEAEKGLAANMGGGSTIATHIKGDDKIVDNLIAPKSNPNIFG